MTPRYCPRNFPQSALRAPSGPGPTVGDVIRAAANDFGVTTTDLLGSSRRVPLVRVRQIAMAAARLVVVGASYPTIGAAFGGRDHTTVMHACQRVADDPRLAAFVQCRWPGVAS